MTALGRWVGKVKWYVNMCVVCFTHFRIFKKETCVHLCSMFGSTTTISRAHCCGVVLVPVVKRGWFFVNLTSL